jgi:ribosome recycling factor
MKITDYKLDFQKTIDHFKQELGGIRTGRATPALVENITVDAYGQKMPVKSLASIAVADPKSLVVEPWDKAILKDMEATIRNAGIGISVVNEGNFLRLVLPQLTEENRKMLARLVNEKAEEARVSIRSWREKVKEKILDAERKKEITEDLRYKMQDELDKMVSDFNAEIKKMAEDKEREIMTV